MRTLVLILSAGWMALSQLSAAPTVQEQANYDAACLAVVEAVNAYRDDNGKAALVPLVELCEAAREDAEYREIGAGVMLDIPTRAFNAGYGGSVPHAFISRGRVPAVTLLHNNIALPGNPDKYLRDDVDYIGVGMALKTEGASTEYHLRIILGIDVPGGPDDGTPGQESGTGRGLLDIALMRAILAGAWVGDSINGFTFDPTVIVLSEAEERAFVAAIAAFLRKNSVVRISEGKAVKVRLPAELLALIESFIVKGRFPPGVRFDKRTNSFKGRAKSSGRFTVTLSGSLKGPVKGSDQLKPIRIQFAIGG